MARKTIRQSSDDESQTAVAVADRNWHEVARLVMASRQIDRLEEETLTPGGQTRLQISATGHELAQVLLGVSLEHEHDAATVYYRSRPFLLASGLTLNEALAASIARAGSPSEGRDVGVIFNLPRRRRATVLPASGNVGVQYTPAAGWAQAIVHRSDVLGEDDWDGAVAVAMGGDGSVASNGFWAALNIATTTQLPMLFFIEDNGFAISVPSTSQYPRGDIAANLESYGGLEIQDADGSDPLVAWQAIRSALQYVRSGQGPCLLRMRVPRLCGHAYNDQQRYRSPEQIEAEARRDPNDRLREYLVSAGIATADQWHQIAADVDREVAAALQTAQAAAQPNTAQTTRHLFYEERPVLGGLRPEGLLTPVGSTVPAVGGEQIDLREAVRRTMRTEMKQNPRMLVFGEDVGLYGGIHGVTRQLQSEFGDQRVIDTSLSEEGIMGRAVGMALGGLLPVPELQFRKYADPAQEQMTDLGTLRWRTAGKFAAPVVVRIPVGYGKSFGDPWHCVNGEASYAHMLGWRIAFPSCAADAAGLLRSALRGDDPVIFLEHRSLLVEARGKSAYPGDEYCLPFGVAATCVRGDALTVITWGDMVHRCLQAAGDFSGRVTVLDLRTIVPWDVEAVLASVQQTGRALVVHEDTLTAGFAGEIIATIAGRAFSDLKAPVQRVCTADCPIPYNAEMMASIVPSVESIRVEIEKMLVIGH